VATGGWDKTIRLWDRATGEPLQTLTAHRGFVRSLAFSPDGRRFISGSEDKSVRLWDLDGAGENAAWHGHTGFVHCVAFSPDGVLAASGSLVGMVKLWPAEAPDSQVTFRNGTGCVGVLALAPDVRRVASAHDGDIRIWHADTGEESARLPGPRGRLGRIAPAFSPDGKTLAASGHGASVNLWDTKGWDCRRVLQGHSSAVSDAVFCPGGALLATTSEDGSIRIWDVSLGTTLRTIQGHRGPANAVAFAPDGRRIASAGEDRRVEVWDVANGNEVARYTGHATGVRDVAFSRDGRAIASVDGAYHGPVMAEVKIWNSLTGQETASLLGHTSLVTAVAYFPSGRRIATASDDRTIKFWDVETAEDVFTLRAHTSGVVSLAVSRDGRWIVSGSIDYTAKTWSTQVPDEEEAAELSLRRAAVERAQALFVRHLLKADVLAPLDAEKSLSPRLRAAALEVAKGRAEGASVLFEAAWLAIVRPAGRTDDYLLALRRLEAACRVVADEPERLAEMRHALALAYYRAGQPGRAIGTISNLKEAPAGQASAPLALDLAVTAMASRKLGRAGDARAALDQLRRLVQTDRWALDAEAQALLREVEGIVDAP
jgi:WD40 repeat protein